MRSIMKLLKLHLNASRHHSGMIMMIVEHRHVFKNEIYRRRFLPIFFGMLSFSKPYNRLEKPEMKL